MGGHNRSSRRISVGAVVPGLQVFISTRNHPLRRADLLQIGFGGATVRCRRWVGAAIVPGEAAVLELVPQDVGGAERLRSTVDSARAHQDGSVEISLRFQNAAAIERFLPRGASRVLDRRDDTRVEPERAEPIDVDVRPKGSAAFANPFRGRLVDVSNTGVGVYFEGEVDVAFAANKADSADISFRVPGASAAALFRCHVHARTPLGRGSRWGFEFDALRTTDFRRQEQLISPYLVTRRLEGLGTR